MPLKWRAIGCALALILSSCGVLAPSLALRVQWTQVNREGGGPWSSGVSLGFGLRPRSEIAAPRVVATEHGVLERTRCRSTKLCKWQLEAERSAQP